jgi:hypothetical protein
MFVSMIFLINTKAQTIIWVVLNIKMLKKITHNLHQLAAFVLIQLWVCEQMIQNPQLFWVLWTKNEFK